MNKNKKHIAALLLVIFTFPLFYQNVHCLRHHSHRCLDCCLNEKEQKVTAKLKHVIICSSERACPICNYKFSLNDVTHVPMFTPKPNEKIVDFNIKPSHSFKPGYLSVVSPRAPPEILA